MALSVESGRGRSPTLDVPVKGDSDIISSLHDDNLEPTNAKLIRRATLKLDVYVIPIVGMFCVSSLALILLFCSSSVQIFCHSW